MRLRSTTFRAILVSALSCSAALAQQLIDGFDRLDRWRPITTHGNACRLDLSLGPGRDGTAMLMDFGFAGYMGNVMAEADLDLPLDDDFTLAFDLRGESPVNHFEVRVIDPDGNVFRNPRMDYDFPRQWTTIRVKRHHLRFGWGPDPGARLTRAAKIVLIVSVSQGGTGRLWVDRLTYAPAGGETLGAGMLSVSSPTGRPPAWDPVHHTLRGWTTDGSIAVDTCTIDLGRIQTIGGATIDWARGARPRRFAIQRAVHEHDWTSLYRAEAPGLSRSYLFFGESEARRVRIIVERDPQQHAVSIDTLRWRGAEVAFSRNDYFSAVAGEEPRGTFPKYFLGRSAAWTVVGVAGDRREALMNELGAIETDKLGFSLEPFLEVDGHVISWADVSATPSLEEGDLPIPTVTWRWGSRAGIQITALGTGQPGASALLVRYRVANLSQRPLRGYLHVAARPFQVNPPWQDFTIVGGTATVPRAWTDGSGLTVQGRPVIPVTKAQRIGVATWDEGEVVRQLRAGRKPASTDALDQNGWASGLLSYALDLAAGEAREIVVAVPWHDSALDLRPGLDDRNAAKTFARHRRTVAKAWREAIGTFDLQLPPSAADLVRTIRSNLAYLLINADSVGMQPGSRSYERSWIRDGSLASVAMLQMGMTRPVRDFIDWYSAYQYPDGMIPCIVEARGPDPVPEHDSPGQYLMMVAEYLRFTRDTAWLRTRWPNVERTVAFIRALRAQRMTEAYRNGPPTERVKFGLVPESISHEGYNPRPMHAYWDQFFVLRGLKDAVEIAEALGEHDAARSYAAERDDFRRCLSASIRGAIANTSIDHIPGCAELGDRDPTSTTIAFSPVQAADLLPEPQLTNTFNWFYDHIRERRSSISWEAYLPYEWRAVGAYVMLGQKDRALDLLRGYLGDRRPAGWNQWPEILLRDPEAGKFIGDMPHSWAASDFIRSVRMLFVYEREADSSLVLGGGIAQAWAREGSGVRVRRLPTHYGPLSYRVRIEGTTATVQIDALRRSPPGGIVVRSPFDAVTVRTDGVTTPAPDERIVRRLPATVRFSAPGRQTPRQ